MLVNKIDLENVGVESVTASRYINMLNRSCPAVTIKALIPSRGRGYGRSPSRHFDIDYALKIAREYEFSSNVKVNNDDWRDLREALDKIKKDKKQ